MFQKHFVHAGRFLSNRGEYRHGRQGLGEVYPYLWMIKGSEGKGSWTSPSDEGESGRGNRKGVDKQ